MQTFSLSVIAAERPFFEGECAALVVPTDDGQYGILAKHNNVIAAIVPGVLRFSLPSGEENVAAVSEGIVKVENNRVLILVDTAEKPDEIDENRARRSAEQAKEAILQKKSIQDYYSAQAKMARAIGRLTAKKYAK